MEEKEVRKELYVCRVEPFFVREANLDAAVDFARQVWENHATIELTGRIIDYAELNENSEDVEVTREEIVEVGKALYLLSQDVNLAAELNWKVIATFLAKLEKATPQ